MCRATKHKLVFGGKSRHSWHARTISKCELVWVLSVYFRFPRGFISRYWAKCLCMQLGKPTINQSNEMCCCTERHMQIGRLLSVSSRTLCQITAKQYSNTFLKKDENENAVTESFKFYQRNLVWQFDLNLHTIEVKPVKWDFLNLDINCLQ